MRRNRTPGCTFDPLGRAWRHSQHVGPVLCCPARCSFLCARVVGVWFGRRCTCVSVFACALSTLHGFRDFETLLVHISTDTRTTHANKRTHMKKHITHAHRRQQIRLRTADTRGAYSSLLASSIRLQPPSDPLTTSRTLTQVTLTRAATGWAGFVEGVSTWWSSSRSPPPAAAAAGEQQPPPGMPSASGGGVVTCVCVCVCVCACGHDI
jgi:hypothetical protein